MKTTLINIKSSFLKRFLSASFAIIIALLAQGAMAENMHASYKVYWSGMHVADLQATTEDNRIVTQIDTKGLVGMVSNYKNQAETTFREHNGEYIPTRFSKKSQKTTGDKHTEIAYSNVGRASTQKSTESHSSQALKDAGELQAVDPLSAFVIAREKVRRAIKLNQTTFSLPTYDGKKLARLEFEILGAQTKSINDEMENVLHIRMTRVPLSGFDANESSTNSVVELYVSNDKHLIPLFADASAPVGHATIIINKRCFPADECA